MSRAWWQRWTRRGDALTPGVDPGVSFSWPRDTDLTDEQIEIAMRGAAAAPGSQPDAGPLPVATTASVAPRLNDDEAAAIRSRPWAYSEEDVAAALMQPGDWRPGPTPVLGNPDAFWSKRQIRAHQAACRGECGDGPYGCDYEEWSR